MIIAIKESNLFANKLAVLTCYWRPDLNGSAVGAHSSAKVVRSREILAVA